MQASGSNDVVVLDASSLSAGWQPEPGSRVVTPSRVWREMEELGAPPFEVGIAEPSPGSLDSVRAASAGTGDDIRLSNADFDLLALASDMGALLVTEDFSVQNLAETLSIPWTSVGRPISEVRKWRYRCKGCLKVFDERYDDCPVCGSELRSYGGKRR